MISLRRRLYRERRRFIIIVLLTFIAGLIAGMNDDRILFGIPFQLAYGAAFTLILTPVLMAIALLFASVRMGMEAIAFSLPFIGVHLAIQQVETSFSEFTFLVLSVMFLQLIFFVYAGGWLDRFLPAKKRAFHSKVQTRLSPEELWPFLVVTPDTVDTYREEKTVSMEWVEAGASFVEVSQVDELTRVEELQTIEQLEPCAAVRVRFNALSAKEGASGSSGVYERTFVKTPRGAQLQSMRCFDRMTPVASFRMWLDDGFGRFDDEYVRRAEKLSGL